MARLYILCARCICIRREGVDVGSVHAALAPSAVQFQLHSTHRPTSRPATPPLPPAVTPWHARPDGLLVIAGEGQTITDAFAAQT